MATMKSIDTGSVYLRDESRLNGNAECVVIPADENDLIEETRKLLTDQKPVTVQGARTGISGAAVPAKGYILSTEKMNRIIGIEKYKEHDIVIAEPGVTLNDLREYLKTSSDHKNFRFMPDPSEATATLGGIYACNAKGMNVCAHGDTAGKVHFVRILLADGTVEEIWRGDCVVTNGTVSLKGGKVLSFEGLKQWDGKTRGFQNISEGMDLLDVIAGSEGMLGVVTRIGVQIDEDTAQKWGVVLFFDEPEDGLKFASDLFENEDHILPGIVAGEFFDAGSLNLITAKKKEMESLKPIPDFPESASCGLYVEMEGESDEVLEEQLMGLLDLFAEHNGKEEDTWAATGDREMEKFKLLRHSVPECINSLIDEKHRADESVTKMCADISGAPGGIIETTTMYQKGISETGIEGYVFGHIMSNHMHVNLVPASPAEMETAEKLIGQWAAFAAENGGKIVTENGIGKLKKRMYLKYADPDAVTQMRRLKAQLDPDGLLNPENMLTE